MTPFASIIIPTRRRPGYLDVALGSIMEQARAGGAEVLVVDDGGEQATAEVAERHGARYVALGRTLGLNAARNAGIEASSGELLAFVDDDVRVHERWLESLSAAAHAHAEIGMFTGPILARLEGRGAKRRTCGREGPPITSADLGPGEHEVERAWGANMAIRRSALRETGEFDPQRRCWGGDEEEWERRYRAGGGRILYVAGAALDHRRAPDDATLRALMLAAARRGLEARRFEEEDGRAPARRSELRTFAGCVWHTIRRRCANGPVMAAHTLGRIASSIRPHRRRATAGAERPASAPGVAATPDFLSGESGTIGGRRDALRAAEDVLLDLAAAPQRLALARRARAAPAQRRVLVLSVVREANQATHERALSELARSRHATTFAQREAGELGKFENLNLLLSEQDPGSHDWLLLLDDDVLLARGFLDGFVHQLEQWKLSLAQPAHRRRSHAAWRVTRRRRGSVTRETLLVEIGPVTALARETFELLLPFPALRMGWGLDAHWAALAREHAWRAGVVDVLPVAHRVAAAGAGYSREAAVGEAQAFLATRAYLPASELQRTLVVHRRCV